MTFINTLVAGDKFTRNGDSTVCTVTARRSEPGLTSVSYTTEGIAGAWTFTGPGLTTVAKVGA